MDTQFETASLSYLKAHRRRVELEKELLDSIQGISLIAYQKVDSGNRYEMERENSVRRVFMEREKVKKKIIVDLHQDRVTEKEKILKSDFDNVAKIIKLQKLDQIFESTKDRVEAASLNGLKKIENLKLIKND